MDDCILRRRESISTTQYHRVHHGETPGGTGGQTDGGPDRDGSCSSAQSFTCEPPRMLEVYGRFGNSDGTRHRCSGGGLCPAILRVRAIMQPGEKRVILSILSKCCHDFSLLYVSTRVCQ